MILKTMCRMGTFTFGYKRIVSVNSVICAYGKPEGLNSKCVGYRFSVKLDDNSIINSILFEDEALANIEYDNFMYAYDKYLIESCTEYSNLLVEKELENHDSKFLNELLDIYYNDNGDFLLSLHSLFMIMPKIQLFYITKENIQLVSDRILPQVFEESTPEMLLFHVDKFLEPALPLFKFGIKIIDDNFEPGKTVIKRSDVIKSDKK